MNTLPVPSRAASGAFAVMLLAIVGAWGFEVIGGFQPCPLCLEQRLGYYLALPLTLVGLCLVGRLPTAARILFLAGAAAIGWSASLGIYQSGAEWGYWPGPDTCAGYGDVTDASNLMAAINAAQVVSCTEVQGRILFLSFAGWNAVAAGVSALLLCLAAFALRHRTRSPSVAPSLR